MNTNTHTHKKKEGVAYTSHYNAATSPPSFTSTLPFHFFCFSFFVYSYRSPHTRPATYSREHDGLLRIMATVDASLTSPLSKLCFFFLFRFLGEWGGGGRVCCCHVCTVLSSVSLYIYILVTVAELSLHFFFAVVVGGGRQS